MKLQTRIDLLLQLADYLQKNNNEWMAVKQDAYIHNRWFSPQFVDLAVQNITGQFLKEEKLVKWAGHYRLDDKISGKNVGIVMAGNIPLVGFHDFLCVFLSGHKQIIKLSSKDEILLKHLIDKMNSWETSVENYVSFADRLNGCDAYIATGSNNSARYFDYYFARYPHIIRRNRTSVAILTGDETIEQLEKLSDDIHTYFGLGCRNVTKIFVPKEYDFVPLLTSFSRYDHFIDHHKYKNNYDYNLSLHIMGNRFYMTDGHVVLSENESFFSPIGQLNYSFYEEIDPLINSLKKSNEIQCIAGIDIPFGKAQSPELNDYADGIDTLQFLLTL